MSGESGGDTFARAKHKEFEALKASILRFGRAEKTTEFGTTVFTGVVSEEVRGDS